MRGGDLRIRAEFPTLEAAVECTAAKVSRKDREMSVARIEFDPKHQDEKKSTKWLAGLMAGVPVVVRWQAREQRGAWYGYVSELTADTSSNFLLDCTGVEAPLRHDTGGIPPGRGLAHALRMLTLRHWIDYVCDSRTTSGGPLERPEGKTDWEWLALLAEEAGTCLHMRGGTLVARPFGQMAAASPKPLLDVAVRDISNTFHQDEEIDPVLSFVVSDKPQVPGGSWPTTAELRMHCVPGTHPMDTVRVTTRSNGVTTAWTVLGATHEMGDGDAISKLILGKLGGLDEWRAKERPANSVQRNVLTTSPFASGLHLRWFKEPPLGNPHRLRSDPEARRWTSVKATV